MGGGVSLHKTRGKPKNDIQTQYLTIDSARSPFSPLTQKFRYGQHRSSTQDTTARETMPLKAITIEMEEGQHSQGVFVEEQDKKQPQRLPTFSWEEEIRASLTPLPEVSNDEVESLHMASLRGSISSPPVSMKGSRPESRKNLGLAKYSVEQRVECCVDQGNNKWRAAFVGEVIDNHNYKLLFDNGENAVYKGRYLRSRPMDKLAIVTAASYGFKGVVKEWVEIHGTVDEVDEDSCTALHRACERGHLALVRYLVEDCNANTSLKLPKGSIYEGATAFDLAFIQGQTEVMKFALNWKNGFEILDVDGNRRRRAIHANFVSQEGDGLQDFLGADFQVRYGTRRGTIASRFMETIRSRIPELHLEHLKFLRVEDFLEMGKFDSFMECQKNMLHVSGNDVIHSNELGHEVLFIAHQWAEVDSVDPDNSQYELACSFLSRALRGQYRYIWTWYSCFEDTETMHKSLSAAILLASCCLIIPEVCEVEVAPGLSPSLIGTKVTNLRSFLKCGWSLMEVLTCLASGQNIYISYKFGNDIEEFYPLTSWEVFHDEDGFLQSTNLYNGFHLGGLRSLPKDMLIQRQKRLWQKCLQDWWQIKVHEDPLKSLHNTVVILLHMIQSKDTFNRMVSFELTSEDISSSGMRDEHMNCISLTDVVHKFDSAGGKDGLSKMRTLLLVLLYCMDKIPA